nr:hypothetical protein [Tanacetum cinerariifolium]
MGCDGEIDDILRIKLSEAESNKEIFTFVAWIRDFNINEPIYSELCYEFYLTYEFDEVCADDEVQTKKIIKFRLGSQAQSLTLLEFADRLGLYHVEELDGDGFDVSHVSKSRSLVLKVIHKMITYGLCQRTTGYDKIQKNDLWLLSMFNARHKNRKARVLTDKVLRSLSALIYCRDLDTTTLRELIHSEGRLILGDPQSGVPRVGIPTPPRASMQDLYESMGNMEIRQGVIERMSIGNRIIRTGMLEYLSTWLGFIVFHYKEPITYTWICLATWRERFMNYLEEQIDGEAMINSIQNGDQPLPVIAQVSLARNAQNAPPTLKDPINETPKDLWDALERQMHGSEYVINDLKKCGYKKDNCELNYKFLNNLQQEWKQYATLMRQTKNLMNINIDALYNILKKNQGDVNDALGYKKKAVVVTSDSLALVAEKTNVSKRKEKVVISSDSKGSGADDFSELNKITALLAKAFNRRKFYSNPTNNNLRTSSTSQSANKKQEFLKMDDKKVEKKADEKKRDMSKVKCYNCKKEGHFAKDCKKANVKDYDYYNTKMLLAKKDSDEQVLLAEDQAWMESNSDSDQEINTNMQNNELNEQIKGLNEKNVDLLDQMKVLKDQLQVKHVVIDTHVECHEKYAKLEEERYEYMIRYSALFDNDKQHRKQVADQEVLFDKMSVELVELDKHTVHMIMPSKDNLYNGRKGIGFENSSYFEKAKDFRPTLYDEKVIGLGYTLLFLTHSDEALEIEKFKRSRENKIEFAYDYGNLNASYVNEKINFKDDYFQEIINPNFDKIDSSFQQTSSLKPYVSNVILKKFIIDLEDEVVSLLEKEKENLKTIESLKSKGFESSENAISELENQSENDCLEVEKECEKVENPKVIAPEMFKLSVSQNVSPCQ